MNSRLFRCLCGTLGCLFIGSVSTPDLVAWQPKKKSKSALESTSKSGEKKPKKKSKTPAKAPQESFSATSSPDLEINTNAPEELDTRVIQITEKSGKPVAVIYTYPWSFNLIAKGLETLYSKEDVRRSIDNLADKLQKSMTKANCFFLIHFCADQLYHSSRILDEYGKKKLIVIVDRKTFEVTADVLKKRINHLYYGPYSWYQDHMIPGKDHDPFGPPYLQLSRDVKVSLLGASFSGPFALVPLYGAGGLGYGKSVYVDHNPDNPPRQLSSEQAKRIRKGIQFALYQMKKLGLTGKKEVDTCLVGNLGKLTQTGQPRISDSMPAKECEKQLNAWLKALPQTEGSQSTSSEATDAKPKDSKSKKKHSLFGKKKKK